MTGTERLRLPRHSRGKRPKFFETPAIDRAMSMILVLANEMSVMRDRMDAMERAAAHLGLDLASAIEALPLDEHALQTREARRQEFFERLFYLTLKEAEEVAEGQTEESYRKALHDIAAT